ncbi:response regulator [Pseudoalteromonas sp.]|uniref:response regulator n=1 Tax=Pseudoalteromonas sp. TaxID=53249 RepID=UPI001BCE1CD1|nr:response regulator [Pseudoalteromonas sp.]
MLNIFDVIRNIIAEQKIILPSFFYIKNLSGYHQCLLHPSKLEKLLPGLSEALVNAHKKDIRGHLCLVKKNNSLVLKINSIVIFNFDEECEFVSPYSAVESQQQCEVETVDELIEVLELNCNQAYSGQDWKWQWVDMNSNKLNVVNIIPVNTKLNADFHADYYAFYPFLDSEIQTVISSLSSSMLNVLLADDSTVSLLTTKAMIENIGAHVTTAENGMQALAICQKEDFDVIILDEKMPEMFGSDVFFNMKSNNLNSKSLKAILSGVTNKKEVDGFINKGADIHLDKPVTKLKLQKLLEISKQKKFDVL